MSGLSLVVAGCRGSMAVSGPQYERFGGNTTCYHAEVEPGHHLLIDAGTGLRQLQHAVAGRTEPQRFTIFLSHYHWDHIQGLPLFPPLYDPASPPQMHQTFDEYKNSKSATINHFYEKLLLLKDMMNTNTAKRIAEQRHAVMVQYLSQFMNEWEGKDIA